MQHQPRVPTDEERASWAHGEDTIRKALAGAPASSLTPPSVCEDLKEFFPLWTMMRLKQYARTASQEFSALLNIEESLDDTFSAVMNLGCEARRRLCCAALLGNVQESKAQVTFEAYVACGDNFKRFRALIVRKLSAMFAAHCDMCEAGDGAGANGASATDELRGIGKQLIEMQVHQHMESAMSNILHDRAELMIEGFRGSFEKPHLDEVMAWMERIALPWLSELIGGEVDQWRVRLEFHVLETFCRLRVSELFDIVREFPESTPAVLDLKVSVRRTHQQPQLIRSLGEAFAQRLLHPGANTSQILDVYVSSIKALRMLDPRGVILEGVAEPIKAYLRGRPDTVRCIVTSLTDDGNSELFEELGQNGLNSMPIEHDDGDDDEDDDDSYVPPLPAGFVGDDSAREAAINALREAADKRRREWMPAPMEADPTKTSRSRRMSNDILSMLVHIYGSKELFVNEYRLMLADKLLANVEFDTEREVRNLELLKLRFGEQPMHTCEIMVKDVAESKRINNNITNAASAAATSSRRSGRAAASASAPSSAMARAHPHLGLEDFSATIVSRQFWPTFQASLT